jgi:hypothetical protein
MMTRKRLLGLGLATIAIAVSMSACGGGGGNGGGTVSGLNGGSALVSVGETPTTTTGNYSLQTPPGFYDVIAVRYSGSAPNRVWLQRNRQFSNNTTSNIDFAQADGTVVRVFDVASGARYEYFITAGWLGNANAYTTPVLETLAGWNSAWNLQRGEAADVALRVYVSPSGATP